MRIKCPSCSADLSIQDDHAGRAVKCPQCGGVIPPARPSSPPPPSREEDEPAPTSRPKATPSSRPTSRDDEGDRPRRRSRRDDDDDDDDRPRPRRRRGAPPEKSNTGMILLIVAGVFLLICGGVGYAVYVAVKKVKEKADEIVEKLMNPATPEKFHLIEYTMTKQQVEMTLGPGRLATMDDLNAAFTAGNIAIQKWTPKVQAGRVLVWKNPNNEDRLFIAFYPNINSNSRVQMKELAAKTSGNSVTDNYINEDDAAYAKKVGVEPQTEMVEVKAEDLIREYTTNATAADRKFKGKELEVSEGRLEKWDGDVAVVSSKNGKGGTMRIRVTFQASQKDDFANYSPNDDIKFSGKCEGRSGQNIVVKNAVFD